jgi:hypothetical protein
MSDPGNNQTPVPAPGGCLTAVMILVGIVLLLPGICAIILIGLDSREILHDASLGLATIAMLGVGAGGIALIWWAVKRPSRMR